MRNSIITVVCFLAWGYAGFLPEANAQSHIETILSIKNEVGKGNNVVFGVDTKASDNLDTALGEVLLPNFHPPGGIHSAFRRRDSIGEYFTYKDFRPMQTTTKFMVEYDLTISPPSSRGDFVIFSWATPMSSYIDSVIISDRLDGSVYRLKLDARGIDTMKNIALELFTVRCYYTRVPTSIEEESVASQQKITLFPNPATNTINIGTDEEIVHCEIVDIRGEIKVKPNIKVVDISDLQSGIYIVRTVKANGNISYSRFIKE